MKYELYTSTRFGVITALDATQDGWLAPGLPILVRGGARIVPLAWWGAADRGYNPDADAAHIAAFASHVQGAALHPEPPAPTSGHTPPELSVALVWAGDEADGSRSLALHLVPAAWRREKPIDDIDLRWSWDNVIALPRHEETRS